MRSKKLGYQIGAEKMFPVELQMVSEEVDLVGEEDSRDRAAVAAVFARPEILIEILVDKPLPEAAPNPNRSREKRLKLDYRDKGR